MGYICLARHGRVILARTMVKGFNDCRFIALISSISLQKEPAFGNEHDRESGNDNSIHRRVRARKGLLENWNMTLCIVWRDGSKIKFVFRFSPIVRQCRDE